tara:strand:- start:929 stop:1144 length:216 start_codon:yes stop_codon:yes gene_type:complete
MSYADSLTEADEFLTYEEGRLQGLRDMYRVVSNEALEKLPSTTPVMGILRVLNNKISEQQTLVDEMRGEEE